jgi:MFS family permease
VTTTAAILFWSSLCSAVSYLLAVPIAARIGLINTMVFTHLPSNVLLILIPFAPNLATAIVLLLARSALSQMDVPTRTSYVMAVVTPSERPAAASITAVPKTFAWAAGSMISGYLLTLSTFGWPLLIGGVIKGVYDILLLIKFQKVRPPEEAEGHSHRQTPVCRARRGYATHRSMPPAATAATIRRRSTIGRACFSSNAQLARGPRSGAGPGPPCETRLRQAAPSYTPSWPRGLLPAMTGQHLAGERLRGGCQ